MIRPKTQTTKILATFALIVMLVLAGCGGTGSGDGGNPVDGNEGNENVSEYEYNSSENNTSNDTETNESSAPAEPEAPDTPTDTTTEDDTTQSDHQDTTETNGDAEDESTQDNPTDDTTDDQEQPDMPDTPEDDAGDDTDAPENNTDDMNDDGANDGSDTDDGNNTNTGDDTNETNEAPTPEPEPSESGPEPETHTLTVNAGEATPIANVEVTIEGPNGETTTKTTGDDGTVMFDVTNGEYTVTGTDATGTSETQTVSINGSDASVLLSTMSEPLPEMSTLSVTVVNQTGSVVEGATVSALGSPLSTGYEPAAEATTDENGVAELELYHDTTYQVRAGSGPISDGTDVRISGDTSMELVINQLEEESENEEPEEQESGNQPGGSAGYIESTESGLAIQNVGDGMGQGDEATDRAAAV